MREEKMRKWNDSDTMRDERPVHVAVESYEYYM